MSVDPTPSEVSPELWASLPRTRVGAGLLVTHPDGRLLLVEPTYQAGWDVPGGLRSWQWCDSDEVRVRTTPFMARRLEAGLRALTTGQAGELEDGHP